MLKTPILVLVASAFLMAATCKTPEIKDGSVAYELKKYELATRLLPADFEKADFEGEKTRLAMMIANSFRYINQTAAAETWYKRAVDLSFSVESREWFARMLLANGKYDAAIVEYKELIRDEPFRRSEFIGIIEACESAIKAESGEHNVQLSNLSINTAQADFSPVRYDGGIVFVSSRSGSVGEEPDQWTGDAFYDLYYANIYETGSGEPATVAAFSEAVNTIYNEGPVTFNRSVTEMYYTHCGTDDRSQDDYCEIMRSERQPDGGWSPGVPVVLFEDLVNIGQPVLAKNDQMLIFTANDSLGGYGGSDLYFSTPTFEGWSPPVNMGSAINTPYDEAFPYIDHEGSLWFSSNGRAGFGGLDIYKATRERHIWGNPVNAGYPLNSSADDFGVIIDKLTADQQYNLELKGMLTSSRPGGKGKDDIYSFVIEKPPALYVLKGRTLTKNYADPNDPSSEVLGLIPLPAAKVEISNAIGSAVEVEHLVSDREGNFEMLVKPKTDYKLIGSKEPAYLNKSETATTKGLKGDPGTTTTVTVDIVLDKRPPDTIQLNIPNIYYDFGEFYIRPDAAAVLDSTILLLLNDNPELVVELGSHTDTRGSARANRILAENRAKAAVEYLISKGIASERLKPNGYGESQPTISDAEIGALETEEEREAAHQRNRRTTFRVLSEKFDVRSFEPEEIIVDPKD